MTSHTAGANKSSKPYSSLVDAVVHVDISKIRRNNGMITMFHWGIAALQYLISFLPAVQ